MTKEEHERLLAVQREINASSVKWRASFDELYMVHRVWEDVGGEHRTLSMEESIDSFRYKYNVYKEPNCPYICLEMTEYWENIVVKTVDVCFEITGGYFVYCPELTQVWGKL